MTPKMKWDEYEKKKQMQREWKWEWEWEWERDLEGEKSVVVVFAFIIVAVAPLNEGGFNTDRQAFKTAAGATEVIKLTINYADPHKKC